MPREPANGTKMKNSQHLATCAWTHMSELLPSLTSAAWSPCWEALIESMLRMIDWAFLLFWPAFTTLGYKLQIISGSSRDNESLDVFMCSFPLLGIAVSICKHKLYSFTFLGSFSLRIVNVKQIKLGKLDWEYQWHLWNIKIKWVIFNS